MVSVGSMVVVILAVVLLVTAGVLVRSRNRLPWPAIVVAAMTAGVCFTVGSDSVKDTSGPSIATVMGAVSGILAVVSAAIALAPLRSRAEDGPAPRTPILLSAGGIALGAIGLLINLLSG
jgi:drug/metabolite transporter (DMT)-like permease